MKLNSSNLIKKNSIWNILGAFIPLIFGIFTIPFLVNELGEDLFGIIVLIWALIGYFSIFDLGIGRSLTHHISLKIGKNDLDDILNIILTSLILLLILGLIASSIIYIFHSSIVDGIKINEDIKKTSLKKAFLYLSYGIPLITISVGLRGVIEAYQRFDLVNFVRIPLGASVFFIPAILVFFNNKNIEDVVTYLFLARLLAIFAYTFIIFKLIPRSNKFKVADYITIKEILKMSGWLTVSNIVGPVMTQLDKFFIGFYLSAAAVAYYGAPYEIITKYLVIPAAISSVFFVTFAFEKGSNSNELYRNLEVGLMVNFVYLFPLMLIFMSLIESLLLFWLGSDMSMESIPIAKCLIIGIFINGISLIPFSFIQGIGRADITAKLHMIELPIYIIMLIISVEKYGLLGVAIAWTLRIFIDACLLIFIAGKTLLKKDSIFRKYIFYMLLSIIFFILVILTDMYYGIFYVLIMSIFLVALFLKILQLNEGKLFNEIKLK